MNKDIDTRFHVMNKDIDTRFRVMKEEIVEYIDKSIDDGLSSRFISNKWEFLFYFFAFILIVYLIFEVISTLKHNSDVDYRNEELKFCSSIYNSDHVILEQCKDYFIILDK